MTQCATDTWVDGFSAAIMLGTHTPHNIMATAMYHGFTVAGIIHVGTLKESSYACKQPSPALATTPFPEPLAAIATVLPDVPRMVTRYPLCAWVVLLCFVRIRYDA